MKHSIKKQLALTLAVLTLIPMLAACSSTSDGGSIETTTAAAGELTTTAAETADPSAALDLESADYDGADFMIAYIAWALYNGNIISDEESGDTINDAVYERTRLTEEKANVNLKMLDLGTTGDILPKIQASVMAGDDAYQLSLVHCIAGIASLATQGLVENWNEVPHVDFTKKWWKSSANENLSINGIQTHVVSEFIRADPVALIFNLEMVEDLGLEEPYALVDDGIWTWDKLIEISGKVSADIDGDGQMTETDRYGYISSHGWELVSIAPSCGQLMMEKDSSGVPQIVFNNDKMHSIIEMLHSFIYDGNDRAYTWASNRETDPNVGGTPPVSFGSGHALFYMIPLTTLPNYRGIEVEFGVLPLPKYDELQERYLSLDWSGMMCVPKVTKAGNLDMIGYVTELLSYYSLETTVPAWYDTLLTDKITRDENSTKMLDIIYSNLVYDYGLNYSEGATTLLYAASQLISDASSDFVSFYEKNIGAAQKHYDTVYEAIIENYSK